MGRTASALLVAALLASTSIAAQQTGEIAGTVVDDVLGGPVADVPVEVQGSDKVRYTDARGRFHFELPEGSHTLRVDVVGFAVGTEVVDVVPQEVTEVVLELARHEVADLLPEFLTAGRIAEMFTSAAITTASGGGGIPARDALSTGQIAGRGYGAYGYVLLSARPVENVALLLELHQLRIQGAVVDGEQVVACLFDAPGDPVAVERSRKW